MAKQITKLKNTAIITKDEITEIFYTLDEFCEYFEQENGKKLLIDSNDSKQRMQKTSMSNREIMTTLIEKIC